MASHLHLGQAERNNMRPIAAGLTLSLLLASAVVRAEATNDVSFEPNRGQSDKAFDFVGYGRGFTVGLNATGISVDSAAPFALRLVGSRAKARAHAREPRAARSHYFRGADPKGWIVGVPQFGRVEYRGVYRGVDVAYYGDKGGVEYDFIVAPRADAGRIRVAIDGASAVTIDPDGQALATIGGHTIRQLRPQAYQLGASGREPVAVRYALAGPRELTFVVGSHDRSRPVVIDPAIVFSTYLGAADWDEGNGVGVDASGNAYVAGLTSQSGTKDASIAKFGPTGQLLYRTVLGGSRNDGATAIAVDAAGNAYVTGWTWSNDFPVNRHIGNAYSGYDDGWVAKLDPSGVVIESVYFSGSFEDHPNAITFDSGGNIYIAGRTTSNDIPVTASAFRTTNAGGEDAFVAKLTPNADGLLFSTYLGGTTDDRANGIAVANGIVYITGRTASLDFPTLSAYQPSFGGGADDAFITKLSASTGALLYSTYLGTADHESAQSIAVDGTGALYVTGWRLKFPPALFGWVARLDPSGSSLTYSIEGRGGQGIAVNAGGQAYVTGRSDIFYTMLSATGGVLNDVAGIGGNAIAITSGGDVIVAGSTDRTDLPAGNAYQPTHADASIFISPKTLYGTLVHRWDAFVTRFTDGATPPPTASPTATQRPSASPTAALTATATPTPSATPTPQNTATATQTPRATPTTLPTTTRIDDTNPSVVYAGAWYTNSNPGHSGGSAQLSTEAGDTVTLSFGGTGISWIGLKDAWSGTANVYIDGSLRATVDAYSASDQLQAVMFTAAGLSSGTHTIQIQVTGNHNASSAQSWIWVDAFDVTTGAGPTATATSTTTSTPSPTPMASATATPTPSATASPTPTATTPPRPTATAPPAPTTTRIEETDSRVKFSGAWYPNANSNESGQSAVLSTEQGDSATVTFTGTGIAWIGLKDAWSGLADIFVDGSLRGTVDGYSATDQHQVVMFTITGLAPQSHTLRIQVKGAHDSNSAQSWVWVDAFDVTS